MNRNKILENLRRNRRVYGFEQAAARNDFKRKITIKRAIEKEKNKECKVILVSNMDNKNNINFTKDGKVAFIFDKNSPYISKIDIKRTTLNVFSYNLGRMMRAPYNFCLSEENKIYILHYILLNIIDNNNIKKSMLNTLTFYKSLLDTYIHRKLTNIKQVLSRISCGNILNDWELCNTVYNTHGICEKCVNNADKVSKLPTDIIEYIFKFL